MKRGSWGGGGGGASLPSTYVVGGGFGVFPMPSLPSNQSSFADTQRQKDLCPFFPFRGAGNRGISARREGSADPKATCDLLIKPAPSNRLSGLLVGIFREVEDVAYKISCTHLSGIFSIVGIGSRVLDKFAKWQIMACFSNHFQMNEMGPSTFKKWGSGGRRWRGR